MDQTLIAAGASLAAAFISGIAAAAAAVYYRNRVADVEACLGAFADKLRRERDYFRSEADIHAKEVQQLRRQVPKRDPRTHRFVKRG